jgi:hypothetical protein
VAQHAGLEKARLVVKRRHARRAAKTGCRVALQAKQVDIAELQHVRIRPAVGQMARLASLDLYRSMLVHKRPLLIRVALEADRVLRRGSPHLFRAHRAVHVVAIAALHQPFIHPMMKRHVELRFLLEMAGVAKLWLGLDQQKLSLLGVVRRVARDATDVILQMHRVDGVHVLRAASMAIQAARADLLRRCAFKSENLGLVSSAVDMGLPRTVATFAALPRRAFLRIQSGYKVRRILKTLKEPFGWHVCVTRFARFRSNVQRWIRWARVALLICFCIRVMFSRRISKGNYCNCKRKAETDETRHPALVPLHAPHRSPVRTRKL